MAGIKAKASRHDGAPVKATGTKAASGTTARIESIHRIALEGRFSGGQTSQSRAMPSVTTPCAHKGRPPASTTANSIVATKTHPPGGTRKRFSRRVHAGACVAIGG